MDGLQVSKTAPVDVPELRLNINRLKEVNELCEKNLINLYATVQNVRSKVDAISGRNTKFHWRSLKLTALKKRSA